MIAVPGNGQVAVSWTAPTNTGTGTISSYTVTYGPTSGTAFTTAGCTTSSTSCTVSGLTNGTAYTFAVTTTTTLSGAHEQVLRLFQAQQPLQQGLLSVHQHLHFPALLAVIAQEVLLLPIIQPAPSP